MKQVICDIDEVAELYAAMTGQPEPEDDEAFDALQEDCVERFHTDLEHFSEIVELLLPLCSQSIGPLTNQPMRGFAKDGFYIIKVYDEDLNG